MYGALAGRCKYAKLGTPAGVWTGSPFAKEPKPPIPSLLRLGSGSSSSAARYGKACLVWIATKARAADSRRGWLEPVGAAICPRTSTDVESVERNWFRMALNNTPASNGYASSEDAASNDAVRAAALPPRMSPLNPNIFWFGEAEADIRLYSRWITGECNSSSR